VNKSGAEVDSAIGQTSLAYAFNSSANARADGLTADTSSSVRLVILVVMGCMKWSTAVAVGMPKTQGRERPRLIATQLFPWVPVDGGAADKVVLRTTMSGTHQGSSGASSQPAGDSPSGTYTECG
jgi:hypothetical protein